MLLASVGPGEVCLTALVMDRYCIDRGTLLDRPRVKTLENPGAHSVHCLVDVGVCNSSPFELLTPPTSGPTNPNPNPDPNLNPNPNPNPNPNQVRLLVDRRSSAAASQVAWR